MNALILIPSRMESTRLPNKPLADICGKPMICHVVDRAKEANIGTVYVAAGNSEIIDVVESYGHNAVLTDSNLPSGSDRIFQAVIRLIEQGLKKPDIIINVQGDEPLLPFSLIQQAAKAFQNENVDVVTFSHPITEKDEINDPSMVKVVTNEEGKALYFSRSPIPHDAKKMQRHIGLYAYRYDALEKFVKAKPSPLEEQEKLEQLRGLEMGLNYYVLETNAAPIGVDTPKDLEKVRELIKKQASK